MEELDIRIGTVAREIAYKYDALNQRDYDSILSDIKAALAREREAALDEACKALCPYCNDPAWPEASERGFHTSPHTGCNFHCNATKVRALKAVGVNQADSQTN